MHIEQLEYIVEVAKTGSLSVASGKLHVSQSALSQSISNLEREFGVKIFRRSRLGAVPTDEGKIIIQKAFQVLLKLQELKDEAHKQKNTISGELRLGTVPGPMTLLIKTIAAFKKDYPNISIEIMEMGSTDIIHDVKQNKVDIGLVTLNLSAVTEQKVSFEVLMRGKMVVAVSRNSPLAFNETVTPEEMLKHPFVLFNDDIGWWFMNRFTSKYGPVEILFSTNNLDAIRRAVTDDLAITVGPDYVVNNEPHVLSGQVVMIEISDHDQESILLGMVRSESKQFSPVVSRFMKKMSTEMGK